MALLRLQWSFVVSVVVADGVSKTSVLLNGLEEAEEVEEVKKAENEIMITKAIVSLASANAENRILVYSVFQRFQ